MLKPIIFYTILLTFNLSLPNNYFLNKNSENYSNEKRNNYQKKYTDSIVVFLNQLKTNEERLDKNYFIETEINTKKLLSRIQQIQFDQEKKNELLFNTYCLLSRIYSRQNNYEQALINSFNAIYLYDTSLNHLQKNKEILLELLTMITIAYIQTENYSEAFTYISKTIDESKKLKDLASLSQSYSILAFLYDKQKEYQKSINYHLKAEKIAQQINDKALIAIIDHNTAYTYIKINELEKAEKLIQKSKIYFKNKNDILSLNDNIFYESLIHKKRGNMTKALYLLNLAVENGKKLKLDEDVIRISLEICDIYNQNQQYNKSISLLHSISSFLKSSEAPELKKSVYEVLYKNYSLLDKSKSALQYFEKFKILSDSIYNLRKMNQIEILKAQFDFKNLQSELKQKEIEIKLAEKTKNNTQKVIIFTIVLFTLISVFLIHAYLKQKKINKIKSKIWETKQEISKLKRIQLNKEIEHKRKEITDFAIHIAEKNELLDDIRKKIKKLKTFKEQNFEKKDLLLFINENIDSNKEKVELYNNIENNADLFYLKLSQEYEELSDKEKRIASLIRLGFSSKQIGAHLKISSASVDNYRSLIRKKMNLDKDISLSEFIKKM